MIIARRRDEGRNECTHKGIYCSTGEINTVTWRT
jgi:hypothetical protein